MSRSGDRVSCVRRRAVWPVAMPASAGSGVSTKDEGPVASVEYVEVLCRVCVWLYGFS
jgi:hypothetical protein